MTVNLPLLPDVSLRERVMQHLATRFKAVAKGATYAAPDGSKGIYGRTWNTVTRKTLTKAEMQQGNALALFDPKESKAVSTGVVNCALLLHVEFFDRVMVGDQPSTILNGMLADVQATIFTDLHCGGLTLNIVEIKSELDIDGPTENLIGGFVEFQVLYRHASGNPRLQK